MRRLFVWATLLASSGCHFAPRLVREDNFVKIYASDPILPHGSSETSLEVKGTIYKHLVSGGYVMMAERHAILFTTSGSSPNQTKVHIVSIDRGPDLTESVDFDNFGSGLMEKPVGASYTCLVRDQNDRLEFSVKAGIDPSPRYYVLDLRTHQFLPMGHGAQ